MDTLRLGNLSFQVPRQAMVSFYAWVVILACMIVLMVLDSSMWMVRFFFFVLYVGMAVLSVYAINCYVVGNCRVLAWVFVAFQIFLAVVYVVMLMSLVVLKMQKPVTMSVKKGK